MHRFAILCAAAALLAACSDQPEPPQRVELNKQFRMIDEQGRQAGTVLFRPLGQGEIRDNDGNLIGVISGRQGD